jgi:3-hydroxyacyl-[acyl-carrier-protein] dehydratase
VDCFGEGVGLDTEAIKQCIPHREPFLWVDDVVELTDTRIHARKRIDSTLDVFRGHYPNQPILPGVLLCEAAMQAGAILIACRPGGEITAGQVPVATRINNVKFRQMVRPGDTLDIEVTLTERHANAYFLEGKVSVGEKVARRFDFACSLASTG